MTNDDLNRAQGVLDAMRWLCVRGFTGLEMRERFKPLTVPTAETVRRASEALRSARNGEWTPVQKYVSNRIIAERCGLSEMTVARVMRQETRHISAKARARVLDAYRELCDANG